MSYESARAVRFLGTVTDITARKQAEEEARRLFDEADASRRVLLSVIEDLKQAEAEVRRLNAELEQRVRDRTAQLRAANKELEAFSYSVSHDLRAPLRAINGYARILAEDHGPRLDADGRRMLDTVRSESLRMGALIDDLLRFSRLGRQRLRKTSTDMTALVGEIHAELRRSLPDRTVEFRLGALPDAPADPALVRQIWVNLLDNAFKFTRRRERAEIAVSGTVHGGEAVYSVHDNGAGFEMRHAGRLFGVFQRLHPAEDFEGTGVGLALVQRLVQRHGGRVWAEAEPERGATFHFTLPLAADAVPPPDDAEERPEG
jgi:light-regulated signal transduction histidine kinase (bacteriophytochrome)